MVLPQVVFILTKGPTIHLVSQTKYLERHPCLWGYIQVHECCKLYLHIYPWIHSSLSLSLSPILSLSDSQCLSPEAQNDCDSHPFVISRHVIVHLLMCVCVCMYIFACVRT